MQKRKFLSGFLAGCLVTSLVFLVSASLFSFLSGRTLKVQNGSCHITKAERNEISNKLTMLEAYIDKYYLNDLSAEDYANGLYKGLFASLNDRYAAYYTEDEYSNVKASTEGKYAGIGAYISYDKKGDFFSVVTAYEKGPADKAGMKSGDILLAVDGQSLTDMDLTKVAAMMKGKAGTKVKISVLRDAQEEPIDLVVTRAEVEADTVKYQMLENQVGYVAITSFKETTQEQFREAIKKLKKDGMKGLIMDVRNNGGGSLTTVVDMLDQILPKGLIVYTRDRNDKGKEYYSTNNEHLDLPMALLVNGNSASASEVFAGALKDHKKATIVGTTTFGKGIVQSMFSLPDGSALKLTTSKYYTPSGKNIHEIGIEPDIKIEMDEMEVDITKPSLKDDPQLDTAYKVVNKKLEVK